LPPSATASREGERVALEAEVRMCRTSGAYDRARAAFDRIVEIVESRADARRYLAAYVARADVDIYQGRFDDARRALDVLRALVEGTPNRPAVVRALMTFARSALAHQAYAEMTGYAREAHRISREIGDREGEALALHTIANGMVYPFHVAEARAAYHEAPEIYTAIGHQVGQACVAVDEGLFHTEIGLLEPAVSTST
jgi:tetratricopeptide (TPR) repeat protein